MDDFGLTPLDGGFSGETFLAEAAGERTVVRIYGRRGAQRGAAAVDVDAAVLRLMRGLFPVPQVLETRAPDLQAGRAGVLVTSLLPGERLDLVLPELGDTERQQMGRQIGAMIARLGQIPMPTPGRFVDGDLTIEPWPEGGSLVEFLSHQRRTSALAHWPGDEFDALIEVADRAQTLLDGIGRFCLVHSDFNPKNLLADRNELEVTGLLDWEFAHAGAPFADLGNMIRFERDPALLDGVVEGYLHLAGHLDGLAAGGPARLLELARAADLLALTELAGRCGQNPVADRAHAQLQQIARTADLAATAS